MAKRFSRKDPKVGEVSNDLVVVHRFLFEGLKYYVVKEASGQLVVWMGTGE
jgi:hypothetical protein